MEYYNEHGFQPYIRSYKKQLTDLWETSYRPTEQETVVSAVVKRDNLIAQHVFKKRKIVRSDELVSYLKDDPADPFNTHVLTWWKVNI